ncbi:axin isoform X2 [Chrysoperla carnea]|uniref:axin isoform X2 n=1 Tax=Chrysoperla carnea TaxID=189513 RepID=UPI001D061BF5|nr:axin isoform X2 [Chrysoperla carnea]
MSGQNTPASHPLDENDDKGVSCSTRPPALGQEHLDSHHEHGWNQEQQESSTHCPQSHTQKSTIATTDISIINYCPESSQSENSPTPSSERPTQLCGQSITPTSERLTVLSDASLPYEDVPDGGNKTFGTNTSSQLKRPQTLLPDKCATNIDTFRTSSSSSDYHRASTKTLYTEYHPSARIISPSFESQPPSFSSTSYESRSPLDFQVPGSVPVRFDCLPESDPHASLRPWLRWALALHYLLHDAKGVNLFRRYLLTEGKQHVDALEFWFAVEGLHGQITPETVAQLVKVIYRRYFTKAQLPIDDQMRRDVAHKYKMAAPHMLADLFDVAQNHVETLMRQTTYPNFLKSDIYLDYVQQMQVVGESSSNDFTSDSGGELSSGGSSGCISIRDLPPTAGGNGGPLPTLHEDSELVTDYYYPPPGYLHHGQRSPLCSPFEPPRLTKDLLLQTQKRRALEVRPKSETLAGDGSSIHQRAVRRKQARQVREAASINRESSSSGHMIIPRTQRPPRDHLKPLSPNEFAKQLTEKLENVLKERDVQEQLDRKLQELCVASDCASSSMVGDMMPEIPPNVPSSLPVAEVPARALAAALKEKLKLDDDNDQDILDQHVSRVWADLTPNRSPGRLTPQVAIRPRNIRKERDVHSTFSSDSGNVMDFTEGSVSGITGIVKSKSMGEYSHDNERFIRLGVNRRSSSRKTLTDLTDSGVSVVSDTLPIISGASTATGKDSRVLSWLFESDRTAKMSQSNSVIPNSPTARHRKGHSHSRSSSLERGSTASNPSITQQTTILPAASTLPIERISDRRRGEPSQPFVADPGMPPLPSPHTPTQLEEARRRLLESDTSSRNRHKDSSSSQSTLRKGGNQGSSSSNASKPYTTVVFNFCDEQFPYRTKIPSVPVTLKQFKDYLPKKGNYRYFFKTAIAELDNQVIQEELSCDSDILPLWDGKIMAQVKPID